MRPASQLEQRSLGIVGQVELAESRLEILAGPHTEATAVATDRLEPKTPPAACTMARSRTTAMRQQRLDPLHEHRSHIAGQSPQCLDRLGISRHQRRSRANRGHHAARTDGPIESRDHRSRRCVLRSRSFGITEFHQGLLIESIREAPSRQGDVPRRGAIGHPGPELAVGVDQVAAFDFDQVAWNHHASRRCRDLVTLLEQPDPTLQHPSIPQHDNAVGRTLNRWPSQHAGCTSNQPDCDQQDRSKARDSNRRNRHAWGTLSGRAGRENTGDDSRRSRSTVRQTRVILHHPPQH